MISLGIAMAIQLIGLGILLSRIGQLKPSALYGGSDIIFLIIQSFLYLGIFYHW